MRKLYVIIIFNFLCFLGLCQNLDSKHYPESKYWKQLSVKNTDTLITCMRYYFCSNDTIYFREHPSLKVVKLALTDLNKPGFSLGKDYRFADKEQRISNQLFFSEKLDRYYDYYLHAPLYDLSKITIKVQVQDTSGTASANKLSWNRSADNQYDPYTSTPHVKYVIHRSGCKYNIERYYFLSGGKLYFKMFDKPGTYSIALTDIQAAEGISALGRDLDLQHRYTYRRNTKRIVLFSFIYFPALVITGPIGIVRGIRYRRYNRAISISC